ncbi:putative reverse transcriptase domain, reverse transcriptase zinc-binding domain protein [Tanacetum coccineum]
MVLVPVVFDQFRDAFSMIYSIFAHSSNFEILTILDIAYHAILTVLDIVYHAILTVLDIVYHAILTVLDIVYHSTLTVLNIVYHAILTVFDIVYHADVAVLLGFGFHVRLVGWIMECVTTTSFSISINGSLHGYFKGKRGLCQGDPLSPYLFTLMMEILTLMISRRVQATDLFTYHRYCSKLELVNLCFADDLYLFAYGDTNSARVIMDALDEF